MRTTNRAIWRTVSAEDIQVGEEMQKGQHIAYDGGKFAVAMDTPTHYFRKWVAQALFDD